MPCCRGISRDKGGTCASGGAHRTIARCGLSTCVSMEHFSRAPAVIAAPAPMVEHIASSAAVSYTVPLAVYAVLAPVAELSLQRLCASAPVVEYIAPAPAVVAALRCAGEPLEDHSPTQASFKTQSRNSGASLTVMTRMSRHSVVAPILAAPLLTDTRRLTVGSGTREDFVAATAPVVAYFVPVLPYSEYILSAPAVSENSRSLAGTFELMAPEDVFQMVALARCSSLHDEITKRCPLRGDERPDMRRRGAHCSCSCSGSSCVQPVGTPGPTGNRG